MGTEQWDCGAVRRSVLAYTLLLAMVQAGVALLLARWPGPARLAWYFLGAALPWTFLVGGLLAANTGLLVTLKGRRLHRLNLATRVSLIRVCCVPLVLTLILARQPIAAGLVFMGAALTDWLDGFLARRTDSVTWLGRIIDPSIDAVFCGSTLLALGACGRLPAWVVGLVVLRYSILVGGAVLLRLLLGTLPVRATFFGRTAYLVQYVLLAALLLLPAARLGAWPGWALGFLQVAVSVQLLGLGLVLFREARRGG
ncbi:MAG: CDP-alcohol phosphatidyltransferase family protein [Candidatus Krumholzibacteriota bacterium]|nr:CDP-alcohol phosphatidyltransferase family protein [Candidatus Krumholzibacteriota bacterium]